MNGSNLARIEITPPVTSLRADGNQELKENHSPRGNLIPQCTDCFPEIIGTMTVQCGSQIAKPSRSLIAITTPGLRHCEQPEI